MKILTDFNVSNSYEWISISVSWFPRSNAKFYHKRRIDDLEFAGREDWFFCEIYRKRIM